MHWYVHKAAVGQQGCLIEWTVDSCLLDQAAWLAGAAGLRAASTLRQAIAVTTSARPDRNRMMPTSSPSAQATLPGQPTMMITASIASAIPLVSVHSRDLGTASSIS